jgi:outer membrane protein OmpA-like peptidoglycan-associated protein
VSRAQSRIGFLASITMLASSLVLPGCGATEMKGLVDARATYARAQAAPGAALMPVPLRDAKIALDTAESTFADQGENEQSRNLAYVATRKAEFALSQGEMAQALAAKAQAEQQLASMTQADLAKTKAGLQNAQSELNKTKSQLNMTAEQLAAEKVARAAADKRARDAMDKLAVAAALSIKEEARGTVIVLPGSVLFATNKYDLLPNAQQKLNAVADALKNQQDDHKMLVEGHTDSQGTEASNMELGNNRAKSVRDYLVSRGVKADAISAVGIGQGRPIADNTSAEGRANNRRVEIIVTALERR